MAETENHNLLRDIRQGIKTVNTGAAVLNMLINSHSAIDHAALKTAQSINADNVKRLLNQMKLLEDQA